MTPDFAAHLEALFACRACPNVFGTPITNAVPDASVMLVGQAPGPRELVDKRPFAFTAGRRLFTWFQQYLKVTEDEFRKRIHICAVIRCFPGKDATGGDRVPDADEIANCGRHLDRELVLSKPKLIIAVGTLAAQQLVGIARLKDAVGVIRRVARAGQKFDVIVLPHPSGRSTWLNKPQNLALLERSMQLIGAHSAFRRTFRIR